MQFMQQRSPEYRVQQKPAAPVSRRGSVLELSDRLYSARPAGLLPPPLPAPTTYSSVQPPPMPPLQQVPFPPSVEEVEPDAAAAARAAAAATAGEGSSARSAAPARKQPAHNDTRNGGGGGVPAPAGRGGSEAVVPQPRRGKQSNGATAATPAGRKPVLWDPVLLEQMM